MPFYRCTNREADSSVSGGFGIVPSPANSYDVVEIVAGQPVQIAPASSGGWSADTIAEIVAAGLPVLVLFHGLGFNGPDAAQWAAQLRATYASHGADATIVFFDWCESGQEVGGVLSLEKPYMDSQAEARDAAPLAADFLWHIAKLRAQLPESCPVTILAHSMGNYVLAGAFDDLPDDITVLCDSVILAAADERYDSFDIADRLSLLPPLVDDKITIYFGDLDKALLASAAVNDIQRLGFDGPKNRSDATKFPPDKFRLVGCSAVEGGVFALGHNYYETDGAAERDVASVILGTAGPVGTIALHDKLVDTAA